MANEELVNSLKNIYVLLRAGNLDTGYAEYQKLFASEAFTSDGANERRQALRMMVHAKGLPTSPTPAMLEAHRAAVAPLTQLARAEWSGEFATGLAAFPDWSMGPPYLTPAARPQLNNPFILLDRDPYVILLGRINSGAVDRCVRDPGH